MRPSRSLSAVVFVLGFVPWLSAQSLNSDLVTNGGFESGATTGWTISGGTIVAEPYGTGSSPIGFDVSLVVDGGTYLWRTTTAHSGAGPTASQLIDVSSHAATIDASNLDIVTSAAIGGFGTDGDNCRVTVRFLNTVAQEISTHTIGPISPTARNLATNLLLRPGRALIPVGTRTLEIVVLFTQVNGGAPTAPLAAIDEVALELQTHLAPVPVALSSNLLVNGGFETGAVTGQPSDGWEIEFGTTLVKPYGVLDVPPFTFSGSIGGGAFLGTGNTALGSGSSVLLTQDIDVTGNAAQINALMVELAISGFLGGQATDADHASLKVMCLGSTGVVLADPMIGPVTSIQRGAETILLLREDSILVPAGTVELRCELRFTQVNGGASTLPRSLADELSVELRPIGVPVPVAYDVELLRNEGFEAGSVIEVNDPESWEFTTGKTVAPTYGLPGVPTFATSSAIGGGNHLLSANTNVGSGGTNVIRQVVDLTENALDVDSGFLVLHIEGHFGGRGNDPDDARFAASYLGSVGQVFGTDCVGQVSSADRAGVTTLLFRSGNFSVPIGTRTIELDLVFTQFNGGSATLPMGLADELSAVLINTLTGGVAAYPGSGEDFQLQTGVNALPSGGPGLDVKSASAGDVLSLRVSSFNGTFVGLSPLLLVAQLFNTGSPPLAAPITGFPEIQFDPSSAVLIVNGLSGTTIFGPQGILPGGNDYFFPVPSGLGGQSVLLQAIALEPMAVNDFFATTDGHEIMF